jgi:hypothetical protein
MATRVEVAVDADQAGMQQTPLAATPSNMVCYCGSSRP